MTNGAYQHDQQDQRPRRRRPTRATAVAVALTALMATSCSSGSTGPGVAGARATTTTATSGRSTSSKQADALLFSRCMRSHGVPDFPDPSSNGGSQIRTGQGGDLDPSSPTFQAAQRACQKYGPGANLTPAQRAQQEQKLLAYAQCMRSHGVANFPDPSPGPNGGFGISINSKMGLDPGSPTFQAAQAACQKVMGGAGPLIAKPGPGASGSRGAGSAGK